VNGPVPVGVTESVLDCPEEIDDGTADGAGADGGVQVTTVTVAALLSKCPAQALMRTQYVVVTDGDTVRDEAVPFGAIVVVSGGFPMYHWKVAAVPVAVTLNVVWLPVAIDLFVGCEEINAPKQ
jgi:hypothetical protein